MWVRLISFSRDISVKQNEGCSKCMSLIKILRAVIKGSEMKWPLSGANLTYIYFYVSHCLCLTHSQADASLHCGTAPLWCCYMSAAWLCFYQILGLFKWMIPVLRRDQRTKKSSLFVRPCPFALPPLSFSESTAAVICYTTKTFFSLQDQSLFGSTHLGRQPSHQRCFKHSVTFWEGPTEGAQDRPDLIHRLELPV